MAESTFSGSAPLAELFKNPVCPPDHFLQWLDILLPRQNTQPRELKEERVYSGPHLEGTVTVRKEWL